MDTILKYIENSFSTLPDSPNIIKLKENIIIEMEEKYIELKAEGKSEEEINSILISDFERVEDMNYELFMGREDEVCNDYEKNASDIWLLVATIIFISAIFITTDVFDMRWAIWVIGGASLYLIAVIISKEVNKRK